MYSDTSQQKRITVNLPRKLLREAQAVTGKNMKETLIEGLAIVRRQRAHDLAMKLKGRLHLKIDLDTSRERHR